MMDNSSLYRTTALMSISPEFAIPLLQKMLSKLWHFSVLLALSLTFCVFISSFPSFDSCIYLPFSLSLNFSPSISSPNLHSLPGPGVWSPVLHPSSLQRLWQACRSSAPPCAVTVWAPEIVTPAQPPLSDTISSPIAKVRAPLHSSLLPHWRNTSSPSSPGIPLPVISVILDPWLFSHHTITATPNGHTHALV